MKDNRKQRRTTSQDSPEGCVDESWLPEGAKPFLWVLSSGLWGDLRGMKGGRECGGYSWPVWKANPSSFPPSHAAFPEEMKENGGKKD